MASAGVLAPGAVFAERFRVVELLGEGEMGATYAVDPLAVGPRCALKVMHASLARDGGWRARFEADAKSTSRVKSAHVLQTLDAGIDAASGDPWFTTELLRGEDLAMRVGRDGARPLPELRALLAALGDALGDAHARGLVHYDLTPDNVHLGPGTPFMAKLRELTISRLISEACAAEGDLIGTAAWMPPEQFELGQPLTPAANVWSLGLLAFYAATGHAYWANASDDPSPSRELLREILHEPLASASVRAKVLGSGDALPAWFDTWFAHCVARAPRDRFADARAARAAFAEAMGRVDGGAAEEDRPTQPMPERRAPQRAPRTVSQVDVEELKKAADPMKAAIAPAKPAPKAPAARKRRGRALPLVLIASVGAGVGWWLWNESASETMPERASSAPLSSAAAIAPGRSGGGKAAAATSAATPRPSGPAAVVAFASGAAPGSLDGDAAADSAAYDIGAALKAINRVYYGGCNVPSDGELAITFAPNGRVQKVAVVQGAYDERTTGCVAARFGAARVPPFRGGPQTVTAKLTPAP